MPPHCNCWRLHRIGRLCTCPSTTVHQFIFAYFTCKHLHQLLPKRRITRKMWSFNKGFWARHSTSEMQVVDADTPAISLVIFRSTDAICHIDALSLFIQDLCVHPVGTDQSISHPLIHHPTSHHSYLMFLLTAVHIIPATIASFVYCLHLCCI